MITKTCANCIFSYRQSKNQTLDKNSLCFASSKTSDPCSLSNDLKHWRLTSNINKTVAKTIDNMLADGILIPVRP